MDETYLRTRGEKKNFLPLILIFLIIVVIAVAVIFLTRGKKYIVSPIPPKPSFEVVFYTPTPLPVTPSSTPSATPKGKKPTVTLAVSVTPKATATPTVKSSPSPTVKPTQ